MSSKIVKTVEINKTELISAINGILILVNQQKKL